MANNLPDKRLNGIYYTPEDLAIHLVTPLMHGPKLSVFDPAYGNGALLLACETVCREFDSPIELNLFGCDIHPINTSLDHIPSQNLIEQDFFEYDYKDKFDVILTNPPYVKHQNQSKEVIKKYRKIIPELNFLSNSSDLWAYFLVKAVTHLRIGGSLGAIVPWAFIQADYSKKLRFWLSDRFREIKFLALKSAYFVGAEERVILLWLKGYGAENKLISSSFANNFTDIHEFHQISLEEWKNHNTIYSNTDEFEQLKYKLLSQFGFSTLGSMANVLIGIVTGANKYFIRNSELWQNLGVENAYTIPIITNAKEITCALNNDRSPDNHLLTLTNESADRFQFIINEGVESGYSERSHSKNRKFWFQIEPGRIPDAFFPYRVSKNPFLVLNERKIQSTNSIHRIYFDSMGEIEQKWCFVSLLSVYGQVSVALYAKTYGRGMLKIEPGALKKTIVYCSNDSCVNSIYTELVNLINTNQRELAVYRATEWLTTQLNVPLSIRQDLETIYHVINQSSSKMSHA